MISKEIFVLQFWNATGCVIKEEQVGESLIYENKRE